jgi:hypothetical protein
MTKKERREEPAAMKTGRRIQRRASTDILLDTSAGRGENFRPRVKKL